MKEIHIELLERVMEVNKGDAFRIHHLFKVWAFSQMIGTAEGLDKETLFILETAAIVHDIGIRSAIEKYGKYAGHIHEEEGVLIARPILKELGFDEPVIEQVLHLVHIHQTKLEAETPEHQILLEADFLANSYEKGLKEDAIVGYAKKVFKTDTGRSMLAKQSGITLVKIFPHKTLEERAVAFNGKLLLDGEYDWGESVGREGW